MKTWICSLSFLMGLGCAQVPKGNMSDRTVASKADARAEDVLNGLPSLQICEASSLDLFSNSSKPVGKMELRTEGGSDPLISFVSSTDPKLNFKMGRGFAAGKDYSEKADMVCTYFLSDSSESTSVYYLCGYQPLPANFREVRKFTRKSTFLIPADSSLYRVCKDQVSCFDFSKCKVQ